MKTILKVILAYLMCLALLSTGCKKDSPSKASDSDTTKNDVNKDTTKNTTIDYTSPSIAKDSLVKIPKPLLDKYNNDGNYNLISLIVGETLINTYSSQLANYFNYDKDSQSGWTQTKNTDGSTTYKWTYPGFAYSILLTYFKSSSESWWKYEEDSASYKYLLYYVSDKGTSGEVDWYTKTYFKDADKLAFKDSYTKSGSSTNSTFTIYSSQSGIETERFEASSNTDRSGTMKIYTQIGETGAPVLQWNYTWDLKGVGTYISYKADGSTVDTSGSF